MNFAVILYDTLRLDYAKKQMKGFRKLLRSPGWHSFEYHWSVAHCSDPNISTVLGSDPPWVTDITTQMGPQYEQVSPYLLQAQFAVRDYFTWAIEPLKVPKFYYWSFEEIAWHKGWDQADLELGAVNKFLEVAKKQGRNYFGFIRDMTCHYPYGSEQELPPRGAGGKIIPLYRRAVNRVDQHILRLVERLLEFDSQTVIVVLADHGEMLGERGHWDHLWRLDNYLVRTPLAFYVPGTVRSEHHLTTQHTDVWPTIMDLAGIKHDKTLYGLSLEPLIRGNSNGYKMQFKDRALWLQGIGAGALTEEIQELQGGMSIDTDNGRTLWRHRALVTPRVKLINNVHVDGVNELQAFDPRDYQETKKLRKYPDQLRKYLPQLPEYHAWEKDLVADRRLAEEMILQRLKKLGYA